MKFQGQCKGQSVPGQGGGAHWLQGVSLGFTTLTPEAGLNLTLKENFTKKTEREGLTLSEKSKMIATCRSLGSGSLAQCECRVEWGVGWGDTDNRHNLCQSVTCSACYWSS